MTEPNIFISYRRKDSAPYARGIYDRLAQRFGEERVFMDLTIPPGSDFVQAIESSVRSAAGVIVVIGPQWVVNAAGKRRLEDPGDFVALEVAAALAENDLVIPVLVGGAAMPPPEDLPEHIKPLSRREALELSDQRWDYDVGRLADRLEQIVPAVAEASRGGAEAPSEGGSWLRTLWERQAIRLALVATAVLLLLFGGWLVFFRGGGDGSLGDRVLARGDSGADVRQLQQLLSGLGFNSGRADGEFNVQTSNAVIAFQTCWGEGLARDGRVTMQMVQALKDPRIVRGTDGAETMTGTAGDNLLFAMGGQDTIDGLGGNDKICAGEGSDTVHGGPGDDRLYGGAGGDTLMGDEGNDDLLGFRDKDMLFGGPGADTLDGGDGQSDSCDVGSPGEGDTISNCEA